jgi:Ca2+-binding EF-hand superfamily protein
LQPPKGKKAKKSGSNIFTLFSQKQIQEFKEAFGIIDADKDGIITANDLKAAFASVGRTKTRIVHLAWPAAPSSVTRCT